MHLGVIAVTGPSTVTVDVVQSCGSLWSHWMLLSADPGSGLDSDVEELDSLKKAWLGSCSGSVRPISPVVVAYGSGLQQEPPFYDQFNLTLTLHINHTSSSSDDQLIVRITPL